MSFIIAALAAGAVLQGEAIEPRLMRLPTIHGDTVVFTYAGDLWVANTSGGIARRLTSAPGVESYPQLSPDGKTVAFTGQYDGLTNIYTIPLEGGEPKRLTYDDEPDICRGWTPDGKIEYITTAGSFINRQTYLWTVDPQGGMPQKTVLGEVTALSWFPDGKTIAYTRQSSFNFNWRRYRGGSQGKIAFYNFPENKYWELPAKREQSFFPMVVGKLVYYISDKANGVQNLFKYDLDTKRDTQVTHYDGADIRTPSTDGKTIVFERDGLLYTYDIVGGTATKIEARILTEALNARPYLRNVSPQISEISLSPSGVRLAVEARGNIFSVPAKHGDTRNFTDLSGSRARHPMWSPDGKTIAYITDQTGGYEIYTEPQLGGTPTQLTSKTKGTITQMAWSPDSKMILFQKTDNTMSILDVATKKITLVGKPPYGYGDSDWSPDSKWLAFTMPGENGMSATYLYELATGKTSAVDDGTYNDSNVSFDMNGKYLYLISSRTFHPSYGQYEFSLKVENSQRVYVVPLSKDTPNPLTIQNDEEPSTEPAAPAPKPQPKTPTPPPAAGGPEVKVDLDGISSRILPLPMDAGMYLACLGANNGVFYFANGTLSKFDFDSRESTPLMAGLPGAFSVNASRTKLAYFTNGILGVLDIHPGLAIGQGRVDTSEVEEIIDPRKEWKQMFWDAWRDVRDRFYDPHYNGVDWDAVGKHYETYLKWVNNRADLNYVLGLMIGELGTSHSYVIGGDMGPMPRTIPVGQLGADYRVVGNNLQFAKIFRGHNYSEVDRGPLAEPGIVVHEGDYLLAVDGKPVDAHTNPDELFLDKVGKYVTLTVNSTPSTTGARKVRVRPVASEGLLRYDDFIDRTQKEVSDMSGGRIGYMHIRDTADQGSVDFIRGFYPQVDKDAVIVDERWNGGGYVQPWFVDTLARKVFAMASQQNAKSSPIEPAIDGPKAMLINGYAGSGGDFFPWMFRHAGLGPLIGERTWGGLVGIDERPNLVDGGIVTVPSFAIYDPTNGEIIAENHGVDPDIEVDLRPDLVATGHDPQIEAAVKYLMDQLAKHPKKQQPIEVPKVNKAGKIGG
ncbi:MAG TPA: PDZ domain-containing protein [Fimbriimonas sp.]|nr:PDZ domain-containing protein [Fimbriimonas sp.]